MPLHKACIFRGCLADLPWGYGSLLMKGEAGMQWACTAHLHLLEGKGWKRIRPDLADRGTAPKALRAGSPRSQGAQADLFRGGP